MSFPAKYLKNEKKKKKKKIKEWLPRAGTCYPHTAGYSCFCGT
jgi:hypothetical protein